MNNKKGEFLMSDVQGSAQTEIASGEVSSNNGSSKDAVSYDTHRKLLAQRKKDQERIQELEAFRQNVDLEKKELEGKKDEVIQELKQSLEKTKNDNMSILRNFTKKTVVGEIAKEALSRGLQREKLPKFLKLTEESFFNNADNPIQIDENFNIANKEVFDSILEKEVTENSEWFIRQASAPNDIVPGPSQMKVPEKKLDDKSLDELAAML